MRRSPVAALACYRRCQDRVTAGWPGFQVKRGERLAQQERFGAAPEKVAENILEDLFTIVLDWRLSEVNNQVGYADMVLTRLGVKQLIVEVKRPGSLAWNERAVDLALAQARRYADEQRVRSIAVSDGILLYARDFVPGGHRDRIFVRLDEPQAPEDLWWLSADGIYRPREDAGGTRLRLLPAIEDDAHMPNSLPADLVHPKYKLPVTCFAYVGSAADPKTWRLPYLLADGTPDHARLPKAIAAILSNYRGARVSSVPESAIPDVLVTLARTAQRLGKLPAASRDGAPVYLQLQDALEQLGRLTDVIP
jgi:hypothetical protein